MPKTLITGGAGFIGLHLARSLAGDGRQVTIADNFARGVHDAEVEALATHQGVEVVDVDFLDPSAVARLGTDYDVVFHLAAIIGVTHVLERPYEVLTQNVQMLAHALDLCRSQTALRRLVFASTSEVYAGTLRSFGMEVPTPEDTPITVGDLAEPRTSYMLSKIYGEAMCRQSGVPFTIVRPHNVYGPRMGLAHVIPQLLQRAHAAPAEGILDVFSVDHRRTFCYIDDAVRLLRACTATDACAGEVLNLGSTDDEVRMGDLAQVVCRVVGKPLQIVALPPTPGSPPRRAPDMARAMRLTGVASSVPLEDGVRRTYDWYRRQVFEGGGISAR